MNGYNILQSDWLLTGESISLVDRFTGDFCNQKVTDLRAGTVWTSFPSFLLEDALELQKQKPTAEPLF